MTYTPKTHTPEPYGDTLYRGITQLSIWLDEDPERIIKTNEQDLENVRTVEMTFEMIERFPNPSEALLDKAEEALYLTSILFWCSVTFAMVYRIQEQLVRELAEFPTAAGEAEIADIRKSLVDIQEILLNSPIYAVARDRAALAGDAKFVTRIDFVNPKWNKPADTTVDAEEKN